MTNWNNIITLAKSGSDNASKAMGVIYQDADCRKKAYYTFKKYENLLPENTEWVDILIEATIRCIKMINNGKTLDNGDAVFWRICKLYSFELMRKKNKDMIQLPVDDDESEEFKMEDDHHVWCKTKLMYYVEQLSPKFKELMLLMYFTKPPEENLDIIAQKMKIDKKAVQPMAWSCRKKLAELVGQNLKDCEDTLFNHGIR